MKMIRESMNAVNEWADCNKHALNLLETLPPLELEGMVPKSKEVMLHKETMTIGSRYGSILVTVIDNEKLKNLINDAYIPRKNDVQNTLFNTVRIQAVHNFIVKHMEGCEDYEELLKFSETKLENSLSPFINSTHRIPVVGEPNKGKNKGAAKSKAKTDSAPAKSTASKTSRMPNVLIHSLEAISATREFRNILIDAGVEVRPFDEEKLIQKCTVDGKVNYTQLFAQLRHNFTNYDLLRSSRKMRRNTYWKLTVRPAVRIAVCEKLMMLTKDGGFHMYLLSHIQSTQAEFTALVMRVASEENFIESMDNEFHKATSRKVFTPARKEFLLSLETI